MQLIKDMKQTYLNYKFEQGCKTPVVVKDTDRRIINKELYGIYTPKARVEAKLDEVHFRLVRTEEYFGIDYQGDSMIILFKNASDEKIKLKDLKASYQKYERYLDRAYMVACKYGSGVIKDTAEGVKVVGNPMRKRYIDKAEQERLICEGYAVRVQ
jgi:hypothetical protein